MSVDEQVVMMGAAKVGKSSLISQFLYGTFSDKYKRTVEEMHQVQKKSENNPIYRILFSANSITLALK